MGKVILNHKPSLKNVKTKALRLIHYTVHIQKQSNIIVNIEVKRVSRDKKRNI